MERNIWSGNSVLKNAFRKRMKHVHKIISALSNIKEDLLVMGIDRIVINYYILSLFLIYSLFS